MIIVKKRVIKTIIIAAAVLLAPVIVLAAMLGKFYYDDAKEAAKLRAQTDIILEYPGKNDFEMNGQIYSWIPQKGYFLLSGTDRGSPVACFRWNTFKLEGLYRLPNEHGFDLYEIYGCWAVFCRADQAEEVEAYYNDNANYDMRNVRCERNYGNTYDKSILLDEGIFEELVRLSPMYPQAQNDFEVTDTDSFHSFRLTAKSLDGLADKREMLFLRGEQFYNRTGVYAMALPKELNEYMLHVLGVR